MLATLSPPKTFLSMSTVFIVVVCLAMVAHGRSLNGPDPLMPFLLSSINGDENSAVAPSTNGQNRVMHVVEQIVRYVSSIKSSENFVDNIVNRQQTDSDKIKVLTFLNKCFEMTHAAIEHEINRMLNMPSNSKKSSSTSSPFSLEDLQQAQSKVNDVLTSIQKRLATLKKWIPPTMPFLGFF